MKYCQNCGTELKPSDSFCPTCGEQINHDNMEHFDEEREFYDKRYQHDYYNKPVNHDDKSSIGFMILSFFIPILGFILYAIWLKDYPKKANSCLNGAVACITLYIGIFIICCGCSTFGSIASM